MRSSRCFVLSVQYQSLSSPGTKIRKVGITPPREGEDRAVDR